MGFFEDLRTQPNKSTNLTSVELNFSSCKKLFVIQNSRKVELLVWSFRRKPFVLSVYQLTVRSNAPINPHAAPFPLPACLNPPPPSILCLSGNILPDLFWGCEIDYCVEFSPHIKKPPTGTAPTSTTPPPNPDPSPNPPPTFTHPPLSHREAP